LMQCGLFSLPRLVVAGRAGLHPADKRGRRVELPDVLVLVVAERSAQLFELLRVVLPALRVQSPCASEAELAVLTRTHTAITRWSTKLEQTSSPAAGRGSGQQKPPPALLTGTLSCCKDTQSVALKYVKRQDNSFNKDHSAVLSMQGAACHTALPEAAGRTSARKLLGISPSPPWYRRPKPERKP